MANTLSESRAIRSRWCQYCQTNMHRMCKGQSCHCPAPHGRTPEEGK